MCSAVASSVGLAKPPLKLGLNMEAADSCLDVFSPTVDLGRDFDTLIHQCLLTQQESAGCVPDSSYDGILPCSVDSRGTDDYKITDTSSEDSFCHLDVPTVLEFEMMDTSDDEVRPECVIPTETTNESSTTTVIPENDCPSDSFVEEEPSDTGDSWQVVEMTKLEDDSISCDTKTSSDKDNHATTPADCGISTNTLEDIEWPALSRSFLGVDKTAKAEVTESTKNMEAKPKSRKKKWKRVAPSNVGFFFYVPSRPTPCPPSCCEEIFAEELEKFEKLLDSDAEKDVTEPSSSDVKDAAVDADADIVEKDEHEMKDVSQTRVSVFGIDDMSLEEAMVLDDYEEALYESQYSLDKVPAKDIRLVEKFAFGASTWADKRIRRKHKWRVIKARLQAKSKATRRISNKAHGVKLYIHHRLQKIADDYDIRYQKMPYYRGLKLKALDKKVIHYNNPAYQAPRRYNPVHNPAPNNPPPPRYALNNRNADQNLADDLVNVLINLQDRDLTPEDYELLLRLDDRVETKTISNAVLQSFPTEAVSADHLELDCQVCMDSYEYGQTRKTLPCGHAFHSECIDTWLTNSSMNCPLDGLPVQE